MKKRVSLEELIRINKEDLLKDKEQLAKIEDQLDTVLSEKKKG